MKREANKATTQNINDTSILWDTAGTGRPLRTLPFAQLMVLTWSFNYASPSLKKTIAAWNINMEPQNESLLFNPNCFVPITSYFLKLTLVMPSSGTQTLASRTPSRLPNWCNCWRRWDEVVNVPPSCAMAEVKQIGEMSLDIHRWRKMDIFTILMEGILDEVTMKSWKCLHEICTCTKMQSFFDGFGEGLLINILGDKAREMFKMARCLWHIWTYQSEVRNSQSWKGSRSEDVRRNMHHDYLFFGDLQPVWTYWLSACISSRSHGPMA